MSLDDRKIIRPSEVHEYVGISKSTAYRRMADGTFPSLLRLSTRCVGWRKSEIDEYLSNLQKVA